MNPGLRSPSVPAARARSVVARADELVSRTQALLTRADTLAIRANARVAAQHHPNRTTTLREWLPLTPRTTHQ